MSLEACPRRPSDGGLARRLWRYQRERFPLLAHGVAIAAFALAALGVSVSFQARPSPPDLATVLAAFASVLGFFVLLRVADEFKDADDDARYRAHRPVPRGLVSLAELAAVGVAAAAVQLFAALWLHPPLVWWLLGIWAYFGLMSAEFFAPAWLKRRPLLYLASHMAILPLIALYASACHWLARGLHPDAASLAGFLVVAVGNGLAFEIGRKLRAPGDERTGVETYSRLWGPRRAAGAWTSAVALAAAGALATAAGIGVLPFVAPVAVVAASLAAALAMSYARRPTRKSAGRIALASQAVVLAVLLALGAPALAETLAGSSLAGPS